MFPLSGVVRPSDWTHVTKCVDNRDCVLDGFLCFQGRDGSFFISYNTKQWVDWSLALSWQLLCLLRCFSLEIVTWFLGLRELRWGASLAWKKQYSCWQQPRVCGWEENVVLQIVSKIFVLFLSWFSGLLQGKEIHVYAWVSFLSLWQRSETIK